MRAFTIGLFVLLFSEVVLGGGGRLVTFGPVSLRMILFAAAIITTSILLLRGKKMSKDYKVLIILFLITLLVGFLRGISNEAQHRLWWEDIKPLLYFLILPFFAVAIKDEKDILIVSLIIRWSSVILAIAFFIVLFLIHTEILPFLHFYAAVLKTEEFFFRGEMTFFYKGFLYLNIGLIFIIFLNRKHKTILATLILLAIVITFTRGFLLALCLTYTVYHFLNSQPVRSVLFTMLAILIIAFGQPAIGYISQGIDAVKNPTKELSKTSSDETTTKVPQKDWLGNRDLSDSGRLQQITEVIERVTPLAFFIGHGFGHGIPSRPVHMEISYLEIFHKQGLLGLAFWSYIFFILLKKFRAAGVNPLKDAFFCGAVFVFFQSLTNQYINNPIGLVMVLITLVSLDLLNYNSPLKNEI